jgi:hypothetical protein
MIGLVDQPEEFLPMTSTPHKRFGLPLAAMAGVAMLLPVAAFAGMMPGDMLGTSDSEIRAALSQRGYVVGDIEMEHGHIQAEAQARDARYEISVDPKTGKIVAIEIDQGDRSSQLERGTAKPAR